MVPFAPYLLLPFTIGWLSVGLSTKVSPLMLRLHNKVISNVRTDNKARDDLTEVSLRASNSRSHTRAPRRHPSEGCVEAFLGLSVHCED